MTVPGILALQGGYAAHGQVLKRMGYNPVEVRTPEDLKKADCLILPGGESTVMIKLLKRCGLFIPLKRSIQEGMPVFGTCAGMILLSSGIEGLAQPVLSAMDCRVRRNAYGRQIDSFEAQLNWGKHSIPALFIRAPQVSSTGKDVEILIRFENSPVLIKQGKRLAASFHPELTGSDLVHRYFMESIC